MRKIIINILTIILMFISYFVIGFGLRYITYNAIYFYSYLEITPLFLTISYIVFFLIILYLLPTKVRLWIYGLSCLIFNILFVSEFLHFKILGRFLDLYDVVLAGDGATYFGYALRQINLSVIIIILISIISMIFAIIMQKKSNLKFNFKRDSFYLILIIFTALIMRYSGIKRLGEYKDGFQSINNPMNVYTDFSNLNLSMEVSGLYEYTLRTTKIFISDTLFRNNKKVQDEVTLYLNNQDNTKEINEYTGIFKDKNLILILLESIDEWLVTDDIMPNLSKMESTGINFTNRYAPTFGGGRTINSEFSANTGLYSVSRGMPIFTYYDNKYPYSLANKFKNSGYIANSVHANTGTFYNRSIFHKNLGFTNHYSIMDLYPDTNYLLDSTLVLDDNIYRLIVPENGKFMTYIATISAHMPYDESNKLCGNKDELDCLKSLSHETDNFLGELVNRLESDDKLDDTVIVLFTDHYNYGYSDLDYIYKYKDTDKYNLLDRVPFVIWSNNITPKNIDNIVTTADITPTILNMFGIDYEPKYYMGKDIFSGNHSSYVYFNDYTWYDGNIYYDNKYNGVIDDYIKNNTTDVNLKIKMNDNIIKSNYFNIIK